MIVKGLTLTQVRGIGWPRGTTIEHLTDGRGARDILLALPRQATQAAFHGSVFRAVSLLLRAGAGHVIIGGLYDFTNLRNWIHFATSPHWAGWQYRGGKKRAAEI